MTLVALALQSQAPVIAEPLYSSTQCTTSEDPTIWGPGEDKINVYVEDNFGEELSWCLVNSSADGISNAQAINVVLAAAEVWNRESRGAILQYAGTKAMERANENCSTFDGPAVFVTLENNCGQNLGNCTNTLGRVTDESNCDEILELRIYGDQNTEDACDARAS